MNAIIMPSCTQRHTLAHANMHTYTYTYTYAYTYTYICICVYIYIQTDAYRMSGLAELKT